MRYNSNKVKGENARKYSLGIYYTFESVLIEG